MLTFNSWPFIAAYVPLVVALYWILRRAAAPRVALGWMALASFAFYAINEPRYPLLIVGSIAWNLLIARRIDAARETAREKEHDAARGRWLALGIGGNLAALVWFKYADWLLLTAQPLTGVAPLGIALPVGISFFTFTQLAFLVDVHQGRARDFDPLRYFLFVTFFPHLVAGPILHHGEMMPQFLRTRRERIAHNLWTGGTMFAIGLAKKVLIADAVSPVANEVFGFAGSGGTLTATAAWAGALAYTVQIYFDFSGYSDMALGLSRMVGIDLPINFNSPYKATDIATFWRRWHITLSRFLRDYLYIPLGGNRRGPTRRYTNLMTTMVIGGLWHGAGWNFLLWGALHGGFLVAHQQWSALRARLRWPALPAPVGWALTFVAVVFAWVPFRAPDLASTLAIWQAMLAGPVADLPWRDTQLLTLGGRLPPLLTLGGLALAWFTPNSQQWMRRARIGLDSPGYDARNLPATAPRIATMRGAIRRCRALAVWRPGLVTALVVGALVGLTLRSMTGHSDFIYFRF